MRRVATRVLAVLAMVAICLLSARGQSAPSQDITQVQVIRYAGDQVLTITTFNDGSSSYSTGGPGVEGKTPNYWNGDSTQNFSTTIKDDDSSFEVTVTTWARPEEGVKQMIKRHLRAVHEWQEQLGLPAEPRE